MAKISRTRLYLACCAAFISAWTPRLISFRVFMLAVAIFSIALISLFVLLKRVGGREVAIEELVAAAICISIPAFAIVMVVCWWLDGKRGERRGFDVGLVDDKTA